MAHEAITFEPHQVAQLVQTMNQMPFSAAVYTPSEELTPEEFLAWLEDVSRCLRGHAVHVADRMAELDQFRADQTATRRFLGLDKISTPDELDLSV